MSLNVLIFVLNAVISSPGKIMFIYEGTNNLVSGAFLNYFSIESFFEEWDCGSDCTSSWSLLTVLLFRN